MISAVDNDSHILFVNAYQTSFCGVDQSTSVGQGNAALFGEEHGARSNALDKMVFETGKALPNFEEELVDKTGAKRVFLTTKSPLKDAGNKVTGVLTSSL